jgi:hypothetical protein
MTPEEKMEVWQALVNEAEALLNALERHELWSQALERQPDLEERAKSTRMAVAKTREGYALGRAHGLDEQHGRELDIAIPQTQQNVAMLRSLLEQLNDVARKQPKELN